MEHLQSYSFSEIPEQCARFDEFAARFGNFCISNYIPVNVMIAYVFNRLGYRLVSSTISKSILPKNSEKVVYELICRIGENEEHFFSLSKSVRDNVYNTLSALNLNVAKSAETIKHHTNTIFMDHNVNQLVERLESLPHNIVPCITG